MSKQPPERPFFWQLFVGLRYLGAVFSSSLSGLISRIAMGSLVVAVSLLILVLSVMNGFKKELEQRILAFVPHLTVEYEYGYPAPEEQAFLEQLSDFPGIRQSSPFSQQLVLLRDGLDAYPILLIGIDDDFVASSHALSRLLPVEVWKKFFETPSGILLSSGISKRFSIARDEKILAITYQENIQADTVNTGIETFLFIDSFHTGTELDKSLAFIPLQTQPASGFYSRYRISLNDVYQADQLAQQLSSRLPGAKITSWTRSHGALYEAIRASRDLVAMLLFLIIAIAVFNVITTLMLLVREAASTIAILKTMGARRGDIMGVFLVLGGGIGFVGSITGCMVGLLLAAVISPAVKQLEQFLGYQFLDSSIYPVDYLPSDILLQDVLLITSVAFLMSLAGALFPAWKAAAIAPARVLKYE